MLTVITATSALTRVLQAHGAVRPVKVDVDRTRKCGIHWPRQQFVYTFTNQQHPYVNGRTIGLQLAYFRAAMNPKWQLKADCLLDSARVARTNEVSILTQSHEGLFKPRSGDLPRPGTVIFASNGGS